ncbi:hypothetical protein DU000_08145 [Parvibium lacunae]|uniref:O-antigen polysaccharide polymerase Wzy n=2 Tax=Parvibium lacunae TaxID=1888893 RepID=A0A368L1K7_9BURK|nr:hypothetical protein DU000_08145 [Parvibium lacunae]
MGDWKIFGYIPITLLLTLMMLNMPWGCAYLSIIILITYLLFRPQYIFHPNNMVFASYGLYVILSSTLTLILSLIEWEYVLPWGQIVFWKEMSLYLLLQVEFTFLVLFFGLRYFCSNRFFIKPIEIHEVSIRSNYTNLLYITCIALVFAFMESTAGVGEWINNYSYTYLAKREGHGLLNVIIIVLGNIAVFLLGMQTILSDRKLLLVFKAIILCIFLSIIGGIKSRFIFLLIVYFSPYLLVMKFRLSTVILFATIFFLLLYLGTLFRTEFFYASAPYFLEMLIGYFNAYQLHDYIVTSREPGLFQTVWQVFVKPLQILGQVSSDASFDISVMLTKEYFPEQWDNEKATQQWPIETELYLNYFGIYLSWIPLLIYAGFLGWIYRLAIIERNYWFLLIYVMEFQRIFSTLRGTLIPWETPIYIGQYLVIYFVCKYTIKHARVRHNASLANAE